MLVAELIIKWGLWATSLSNHIWLEYLCMSKWSEKTLCVSEEKHTQLVWQVPCDLRMMSMYLYSTIEKTEAPKI